MHNGPLFRCRRMASTPSVMEQMGLTINKIGVIQRFISKAWQINSTLNIHHKLQYRNSIFKTKLLSGARIRIKLKSVGHPCAVHCKKVCAQNNHYLNIHTCKSNKKLKIPRQANILKTQMAQFSPYAIKL